MANEVNKPDFSFQWSSGGSIVAPSNVKIQTGWTAEVPPFQWENWSQNRQDNAILHLFQKGISEWDAASDYYFTTSGVRSYVQGSDGNIYVALQDSLNQNPVTATTFWRLAFSPPKGIQRFTSNGSFTVPSWVTTIYVSGCGGGGGGGSTLATNSTSFVTGGSGGGAGQSVVRTPITVTPGAVIPITIGTGGTGGTPAANNATAGTATQVGAGGALLNLAGGSQGLAGIGGTTITSLGGPPGGAGFPAGGYAQDTTVFAAGQASGAFGGVGGSSPFGNSGPPGRGASNVSITASPGFGFGAGGSGAGGAYVSSVSAPGQPGAAGLPGILIIEW